MNIVLAGLRRSPLLFLLALVPFLLPGALAAQPFGAWLTLNGASGTYAEVPHSPALNPTGGFTFEAWVAVTDSGGCSSIAGKNYVTAWWVGVCGTTLRSYLHGSSSLRNGGTIPPGQWTHVAVTWDGAVRRHYINGEQVASFADTAPPTASTSPFEIGSDAAYHHSPIGAIDEVRLWNVARTSAELRAAINEPIAAGETGLVAAWGLNANLEDVTGAHDGAGVGGPGFLTFPAGPHCTASTATSLCLADRFAVSVTWRNYVGATGVGTVASCGTSNSGLFWFFDPSNWELLVKDVNACGLNERYWIYSAATTDVFYRMEVFDTVGFANKIYFNYLGTPAPAVTDSDAFATCP